MVNSVISSPLALPLALSSPISLDLRVNFRYKSPMSTENQNTPVSSVMSPEAAPVAKPEEKETIGEVARSGMIAIVLALIVRTFLFEPFNIPSSSMVPNLLVGDYLFISKYAYGYSKHSFPFGIAGFEGRIDAKLPNRGDVIVFKLPTNTNIDYIKRLVGLPGDTIQMINGRLYINDEIVPRKAKGMTEYQKEGGLTQKVMEYVETLPGGTDHIIYEESDQAPLDNTEKYKVPEGHYFMMGDNRDNSQDSRVSSMVGYVPYDNLEGRAEFLFFSTNGSAQVFEFWKWPSATRWSRLFTSIGNGKAPEAHK
jgi:signal peptidase I